MCVDPNGPNTIATALGLATLNVNTCLGDKNGGEDDMKGYDVIVVSQPGDFLQCVLCRKEKERPVVCYSNLDLARTTVSDSQPSKNKMGLRKFRLILYDEVHRDSFKNNIIKIAVDKTVTSINSWSGTAVVLNAQIESNLAGDKESTLLGFFDNSVKRPSMVKNNRSAL